MTKERFIVKVAETEEELKATYHLRYMDMVLEYDKNYHNDEEMDITEADKYAKQVIIVDTETNDVIGCYRIIDSKYFTKDFSRFVCEDEYNIDYLKRQNVRICELSRAVIKKEFRTGAALLLIWNFIYRYMREQQIRYLIGDASFFGTDPHIYQEELSYLANNFGINDDYNIKSYDKNQVKILPNEEIDVDKVKNNLPALVKAYISFGAKISKESFVDQEFKSVDVFILFDFQNHNERFMKKLLRIND